MLRLPVAKGRLYRNELNSTAQKMKFSIKDFFSKRDQIRRKLQRRRLMV